MAGVRIRALTTPRLIKLTSTRCRSARQLNIGRRSTYQGGDSVQTTGATSTFAIKHHGKTMKQRISLKLVRAWLVRHIIFKARDDVAFQHLQQAWIDGPAHHKKWLAVHGVDPIISRRTQTQALARDVVLG